MAFRKYTKGEKLDVVAAADAPSTLQKFGVNTTPTCTCYPGMCPQGCEPACPSCATESLTEK